jgi:hypothetical protein
MNNGIWNKERGPIGDTGSPGPIGPDGPVFDGSTPLNLLTVNGITTLNGNLNKTSGTTVLNSLDVAPDTDISASIGRTLIDARFATSMCISNIALPGSFDLALLQDIVGATLVNAKSGQTVTIRNNVTNVLAEFSGSAIDLLKPTTISSSSGSTGVALLTVNNTDGSGHNGNALELQGGSNSALSETFQVKDFSGNVDFYINGIGETIIGSDSSNGVDLLQVGSNTDISASIGNLKIGNVFSDSMILSHYDRSTATGFALYQAPSGTTVLNADAGRLVEIKNVGSNTIATFSGSAISFKKALTFDVGSAETLIGTVTDNSTLNWGVGSAGKQRSSVTTRGSWNGSTNGNGYVQIRVGDGTTEHTVANFTSSAISLLKNTTITGSLSKSSGSFRITHPLKEKEKTHELVHSFVEAPQADNIYRGKVNLIDGKATVNIDTVAGMTEGTFVALNREVQIFTTNESGFCMVRGYVKGNIVTIESEHYCEDLISWMVIGERHDKHMYDTAWTDDDGKVIVEPELDIIE